MNGLIGWVLACEACRCVDGVEPLVEGDMARLLSVQRDISAHERLELLQASYRVHDAFLPHVSEATPVPPDIARQRLKRIGGHGQLRLQLAKPKAENQRTQPVTGRAHLRALREARKADDLWRDHALAILRTISADFPALERRVIKRDRVMVLDLLAPSWLEGELRRRIDAAILRLGSDCAVPGDLTASGLWAPLAFATGVEAAADA